jgi:hypothetical protein
LGLAYCAQSFWANGERFKLGFFIVLHLIIVFAPILSSIVVAESCRGVKGY